MHKYIIRAMVLLLAATAVLSCSAEMGPLEDSDNKEFSITVTGAVSDLETNKPIRDIQITMYALESNDDESKLTISHESTDESGNFTINMTGFRNPASFTIKAEDPDGIYESSTHEIPLVKWTSSYNVSRGTLYVNDCNFYLSEDE